MIHNPYYVEPTRLPLKLQQRPEARIVVQPIPGWVETTALVSVHSTSYPPVPWFGDCGPTTEIEPLYWQDVLSPSGKWHELWTTPKAFVAVYDLAGPGVGSCDFWNNVTGMLLAEGQVQWMYVDNDLTGGAAYGGTGGNVWQLKASGKVTNVVTGNLTGTT